MTAQEIISNIKNLKSGGKPTDDSSISDSQWMFIIDYYRSQLLKQQISKGQSINEQCLQELKSSKITLTQSTIEKCEMYTNHIPKVVEGLFGNYFTFVGTPKGKSYQHISYNASQWTKYSKYVGNLGKWYELGSVITVVNHTRSIPLSIKALFENPIEVITFNGELDEMNPFNFEYPMSNGMVDSVIKMIMDAEMKLSMIIPKDNLNDGKDGE